MDGVTHPKDSAWPAMPHPFDYCYEWDGPYGTRKFSAAPHNGRQCDRAVPIYTVDQLREYGRQVAEACAKLAEETTGRSRFMRGAINGTKPEPCEVAAAIRDAFGVKP